MEIDAYCYFESDDSRLCAHPDSNIETEIDVEPDRTVCTDPRLEMCTREYNPVCTRLASSKDKTHATGRTACLDARIESCVAGKFLTSADQPVLHLE